MHVSVICTFGHRSAAAAALFPMRGDFLASKRAHTAQAGSPTDTERLEEESLKVEGKCHVNVLICMSGKSALCLCGTKKLSIKLICANRIMTHKMPCIHEWELKVLI